MGSPRKRRIYAGRSAEERADDRRRRLLEAGLRIIGSEGYRASRVTDICRAAGVSQRSFYEAFPDSEHLLIALYHQEFERLIQAVAGRARLRPRRSAGVDP